MTDQLKFKCFHFFIVVLVSMHGSDALKLTSDVLHEKTIFDIAKEVIEEYPDIADAVRSTIGRLPEDERSSIQPLIDTIIPFAANDSTSENVSDSRSGCDICVVSNVTLTPIAVVVVTYVWYVTLH